MKNKVQLFLYFNAEEIFSSACPFCRSSSQEARCLQPPDESNALLLSAVPFVTSQSSYCYTVWSLSSSVVSRTARTAGENGSQDATAPGPGPGQGPGPGTGTTNTASLAPNTDEKLETTGTTRTAAPPPSSPGSRRGVGTAELLQLHLLPTVT